MANKSLIRLSGLDSYSFLQGLITNDVRHLLQGYSPSLHHQSDQLTPQPVRSLYAFVLGTNGRVFCDLIVHNIGPTTAYEPINKERSLSFAGDENHELLLEVDARNANRLLSLFKLHKLRRQLRLLLDEQYQLWTLFPNLEWPEDFFGERRPKAAFKVFADSKSDQVWLNQDVRLPELGYRVLIRSNDCNSFDQFKTILLPYSDRFNWDEVSEASIDEYTLYRHRLGVGEGLFDHPPDGCFPLEDNADLLNGVSFTKGCYLGQELTARVYHTGVIRKRLMPVQVMQGKQTDENLFKFGTLLTSHKNPKMKLGRIRTIHDGFGICLLFVDQLEKVDYECYNAELDLTLKAYRPFWWPDKL